MAELIYAETVVLPLVILKEQYSGSWNVSPSAMWALKQACSMGKSIAVSEKLQGKLERQYMGKGIKGNAIHNPVSCFLPVLC